MTTFCFVCQIYSVRIRIFKHGIMLHLELISLGNNEEELKIRTETILLSSGFIISHCYITASLIKDTFCIVKNVLVVHFDMRAWPDYFCSLADSLSRESITMIFGKISEKGFKLVSFLGQRNWKKGLVFSKSSLKILKRVCFPYSNHAGYS